MKLTDVNPYMRYAELQPSVLSSAPLSCSYDFRLFYILDGKAELVLRDGTAELSPGTLVYFRPGEPYYFDGKVKVIVLNFDMTRAHESITTPIKPSCDLDSFDALGVVENDPPPELSSLAVIRGAHELEAKFHECLRHYLYPTRVSDAATSALIKELLTFVADADRETEQIAELVQRISLYIRQNFDKEVTNTSIAEQLGYHSYYLNRIFKSSTGITIHRAVINERLKIAKRLLRDTALTVSEIAAESGFGDKAQFSTAFRKYLDSTPTEYRKRRSRHK